MPVCGSLKACDWLLHFVFSLTLVCKLGRACVRHRRAESLLGKGEKTPQRSQILLSLLYCIDRWGVSDALRGLEPMDETRT